MAKSVLELAVGTGQWDAGLRKAKSALDNFTQSQGGLQQALEKDSENLRKFVSMMGGMESKAKTAKGQMNDYKSTIEQLTMQYNRMTEAQKKTIGQDYLNSIEQIKEKFRQAKTEMEGINKSLNDNGEAGKGTSSVMEMLKDKFTVNIDAIKLFNIGLQAAEGALNVAKDAFFASEATVDEWGRVVDSSKSLYQGFLTALNTGDISGYLGRIDEIVTAARKAYDELDRLGTMKTIQAPKMSAQQTENERMRMMIQTGRYIAPVDGRRASMKDGQLLTPEQIRGLETKLQNGMKTVVSLVGNEVKQTGKAIDAVYDRQAKELGLSLKEFRKGTSSMAEFDKRMAGYEQYQKWREQHTTIDIKSGRETVARGNPFEQFAKWGTFRVDGQRYNDLVRLIQQRDQQAGQAYSMQSQAYRTMNRAEGVTVSKLMRGETAGGTTGGRGGGSRGGFDLSKIAFDPNKAALSAMKGVDTGPSEIWKAITEGAKESTSSVEDLTKAFEKLNAVQGVTSGEGVKDSSEMAKSWSNAGTAISAVGSAMSQIEDPAAKVMATVAQAIATIALTYAKSLEGTFTPWDWIAGAASGLATMINVISAIHSSTGYAQGGVIKGNSYSGDNIGGMVDGGAGGFVGLNAGEVVLNAAQQRGVASALSEGGNRRIEVFGRLSGETIYLSSDRYTRRTGRGTIMTWK